MPSKLHPLGKNGPLVPALGFGLMGMSQADYGALPGNEYQYCDSEALLGKWFRRTGKRDQIFLATNFGFVEHSVTYETDSSAAYCKEACAKSLQKLGVGTIDLHYLHSANPETPIETMRAMVELQAEGKIKHIGPSMISSTTLRRAYKITPVAAVQTECSHSRHESSGYLPRFSAENAPTNTVTVNQFKAFADRKGCTVAQLALAWLLKRGDDIFPIPGTKIKYLEENWAAQGISLSDEEEAEIDTFLESATIAGGTLPP
ncbi:oxidoreductase, putative [Talaromyces stipitatus ATCC 10500]|uniref:Oxidoreductase, putative n=1 Tax=Talaromyces stipitatus (strain ATCC 10500 / CBS 375.48 / QM 6759 / NRRL 1006) TaxID=441959 RepID=B8M2S7_TALSN|nr:oxidoreductase, putative [Talaromyces stipitatus ATCC 10500]EED22182.1 oxidoreductase, putative [Talaromyces stipitatus ATCC 10500]